MRGSVAVVVVRKNKGVVVWSLIIRRGWVVDPYNSALYQWFISVHALPTIDDDFDCSTLRARLTAVCTYIYPTPDESTYERPYHHHHPTAPTIRRLHNRQYLPSILLQVSWAWDVTLTTSSPSIIHSPTIKFLWLSIFYAFI